MPWILNDGFRIGWSGGFSVHLNSEKDVKKASEILEL